MSQPYPLSTGLWVPGVITYPPSHPPHFPQPGFSGEGRLSVKVTIGSMQPVPVAAHFGGAGALSGAATKHPQIWRAPQFGGSGTLSVTVTSS